MIFPPKSTPRKIGLYNTSNDKKKKIVKYKSILKLSENHQFLKIAAPFKAQARCLKIEGHKWILHKYDPDVFFPSCPHFDCCDQKWKLDIYSGKIYNSSNHSYVGKIPYRVVKEKIWGDDTIVNMIIDIRKRYELEKEKSARSISAITFYW